MSEIHVTTLGQLRIQRDGQNLTDFISIKAVLLFVYLALNSGEHARKKLAATFWSETHDEQALKNLRTVLASIRQNLPDALLIDRDSLAINPGIVIQVDAIRFEHGCDAVFSASSRQGLMQEMQALVGIFQGDFLAGVAFREAAALEEWMTGKQRQLNHLHIRLLHEIVELAEKQGDYGVALQYARKLVSHDPYWDAANRQLMRLLTYNNRANEALLHFEQFNSLLARELGAEPEEETKTLYRQIQSRQIHPPPPKRSTIILPDMPFVEAVDDIALVERMLNTPQCHLLTIYGISGVGKTALATQVAFQRQPLYRDGAYVITLKRAQTARDLPFLIARALGIDIANQTHAAELEIIVLDYLKERHLLLVLDSYEHLLPETRLVQQILENATNVQLIITSQASLNLFREWLLPLNGLRVPAPDDPAPENSESVRLFQLTAQRSNPRFNLHTNLVDVVEICRLVEGLPLALIIAASWTKIVPTSKIKDFIIEGQAFSLPLHQDLPPHHQSLEMMLEYTWNTLSSQEQYALTALSIFSISFDLEEAEQIASIKLDLLTVMIQKALVQQYGEKYRMHQLVWLYARKKLLYSDQRATLGEQYMAYTMQKLYQLQEQQQPLHEYLQAIETEYPSIWNFDWMVKSFQPTYVLNLSKFLLPYWETLCSDEIPQLQNLFVGIHARELSPERRMLLNMQLARFSIQGSKYDQANQYLHAILNENALNAEWGDWSMVFILLLMTFRSSAGVSVTDHPDSVFVRSTYLKLLALYLDIRDYEPTEDFFPLLVENFNQPVEHAYILTIQAAISAATGQYSTAYNLFNQALNSLSPDNEPPLQLTLHTLLMRTAHQLRQQNNTHHYLWSALQLANNLKAVPTILQLLMFCDELPVMVEFVDQMHELVQHLQDWSPEKVNQKLLDNTIDRITTILQAN